MLYRTTQLLSALLCLPLLALGVDAQAQTRSRSIRSVDVQKLANGVLGVMSYTVVPDVTTSSLSIQSGSGDSTDLGMTQFGGGFTWSKQSPLYMEGNAAYARYDPVFVASDGGSQRLVPVKWNSVSVTGGIGWDFPIAPYWVARPIFNFTYGEIASDLDVAKWWIANNTEADLAFLDHGKLKAYGLGGALMFDYERFTPGVDDDLEIRYTNVELRSMGSTSMGVEGHARSESLSVWGRRRIPTGWGFVWERPVRYVFEGAYTRFLGNEKETGLTQMSSLGLGLELDSSAYDVWATRFRLVGRYKFGPGMRGYSVGMAISF